MNKKCELCGRPHEELNEVEEIVYDGNTFQACETCRNYLEGEPYESGELKNET